MAPLTLAFPTPRNWWQKRYSQMSPVRHTQIGRFAYTSGVSIQVLGCHAWVTSQPLELIGRRCSAHTHTTTNTQRASVTV
jgi:hypothetical protein